MKKFNYVLFDNYNTLNDFNLYIQSIEVSDAEIKTEIIDIPGSDGALDFTESLTGEPKFNNRQIIIHLANLRGKIYWQEYSRIQNAIHGKKMRIILSNDLGFFYIGRVKVKAFNYEGSNLIKDIYIECDVEPYKYDIISSDEDWLWDPFDFETGIINETGNIEINGEKVVRIYGRRKKVVPVIKVASENGLTVTFNSKTYNLSSGRQKVLDVQICEGMNVLTFRGHGTVSIEYRGGSL